MTPFDLYIIGPITIDYDEHQGKVKTIMGGPVVFSAYAALASQYRVGLLGKLAEEDLHVAQLIYLRDLTLLPTAKSTSVRVIYPGPGRDVRTLQVLSVIDRFVVEDIPEVESRCYQLVGNLNGQIDHALFPYLAQKGKIACDMQGFVREVLEDGSVADVDWPEKKTYLPYIDYLKVDSDEAAIMTGTTDREEAARMLYGWGAKEVLLTHRDEVIVYDGTLHRFPFRPRNVSGRSGRGDTTIGCYAAERNHRSVDAALLYTAGLVSLKQETFGPFKGSRSDVIAYLKAYYADVMTPGLLSELEMPVNTEGEGYDEKV